MINTIQTALTGMNTATRRVEGVATRIAEGGAGADLPTEMVNLTLGKVEFKANAKVLETASEMTDSLLHVFDKRV